MHFSERSKKLKTSQYFAAKSLLSSTELRRFLQLLKQVFAHIRKNLVHSSMQKTSKSFFVASIWQLQVSALSVGFPLDLGPETGWATHDLYMFVLYHSLVALAVRVGSLSYWKTHAQPILSLLAKGRRFSHDLTVRGSIHLPIHTVK